MRHMVLFALLFGFALHGYAVELLGGSPLSAISYEASLTSSRRLVALDHGGLWISQDAGTTWEPLNDEILSPGEHDSEIYDLFALDPGGDTLFARYEGIMESWMYQGSVDGGNTWFPVRAGAGYNYSHFIVIDRTNHNRLYHITPSTFTVSDDLGRTWTRDQVWVYDETGNQKSAFFQDVEQDSTLFIGGFAIFDHQPGGVFRSEDLGATWTPLIDPEGLLNFTDVYIQPLIQLRSGTLLAFLKRATDADGQFRNYFNFYLQSEDRGDTWDSITPTGLPSAFSVTCVVEDPAVDNVVYLAGRDLHGVYGLYISTDGGSSFEQVTDALPYPYMRISSLRANPFTNSVYLSTIGYGVLSTADQGATFTAVPLPSFLGRAGSITIAGTTVVSTGYSDPRVSFHPGPEANWQSVPFSFVPPLNVRRIASSLLLGDRLLSFLYRYNPTTDSSSAQMVFTDDGGQTWDRNAEQFVFSGSSAFRRPSVFRTSTFLRLVSTLSAESPDEPWRFIVSTDTGRTWTVHPGLGTSYPTVVELTQSETSIFASYLPGSILQSRDECETWTDLHFPGTASRVSLLWNEPDSCLYAFSRDSLYQYSQNTWRATGSTENVSTPALVPGDPPLIFTITHSTVTYSQDRGQNWIPLSDLPFEHSLGNRWECFYDPDNNRVWVSTSLGPMYVDLEELRVADDSGPALHPSDQALVAISPNPCNASSTVRFAVSRPGRVSMVLYDIQGRKVRTLLDDERSVGTYRIPLNTSDLASGTYFLRVKLPREQVTRKVTVLK